MTMFQQDRQEVYDYCKTMLGDGMVDVDLDPKHYELALSRALIKYRQRSPNSVEESYLFLTLEEDKNDYILPNEVINVQSIYRRSLGSRNSGNSGDLIDPFSLAYTNTYLLNSTSMGGISTYYLFASYQELVGKMFGNFIEFQWSASTKLLRILQRPLATGEVILLKCQNFKPDTSIINDVYAKPWIRDYALASCKLMLGEARSKFGSIVGPQGGTQLNGPALIQAGTSEIEKLEKDLELLIAGGTGYSFIIG